LANNGSLQNVIVVATTCSKVFLLSVSTETLVFDAGYFWIVEAAFRRLPRVISTETGYAGGITTSPTYRDVCKIETQDAEVRRLPRVITTETGYAGGITTSPTYGDVCEIETQDAEVIKEKFDPVVLKPRILVDCFLALNDRTKVRAMGKHAAGTGQYRSCIFVVNNEMEIS
jgi:peptide methionine sulfoxide reductase MsrA